LIRPLVAMAALLAFASAARAQIPAPLPTVQTPGPARPPASPLMIQAPTGPPLVPMPPGMQLPAAPGPNVPAAPPANPWESRGTADLVALDKIDDRVVNLSVAVGQSATFFHLTIVVRACVVRPADQPADAAAYLDISDSRPTQPGFHGWMLANEPAASLLQHPVYDVRVTGCH